MSEFTNDLKKIFNYLFDADNKYLSLSPEDKKNFIEEQVSLFYEIFLSETGINFKKGSSIDEKEKLSKNFITDNDQDAVDSLIDACMKSFIPTAINNLNKN